MRKPQILHYKTYSSYSATSEELGPPCPISFIIVENNSRRSQSVSIIEQGGKWSVKGKGVTTTVFFRGGGVSKTIMPEKKQITSRRKRVK